MACLLALVLALPMDSFARDLKQRNDFRRTLVCPATGKARGACPGYVVDHIRPLCAGGADHPSNMQWQTTAEAKQKDRLEAVECAAQRRQRVVPRKPSSGRPL